MDKIKILDNASIQQRLKRIAYEVYESHYLEKELLVIGIDERGGKLANVLAEQLSEISPLDLTQVDAHLDRDSEAPSIGIELNIGLEEIKDRPILVVDDVLYTGTTMMNVVSILLYAFPKSIRTAVLVDRGHRMLPVSADFVGLQLATTYHQHVAFELQGEDMSAYLL
ncbi:MAG: phosphoribosyltransferase [Bacteroidia bacterium]|nr:phosphoribosyltransferase [Bacteroidia bacterium]